MADHDKNEKLIGDLIKKRKQANSAFVKLLHAIESKGPSTAGQPKEDQPKEKRKPKS